jgi:hypothetical protein
MCNPGFSVIGLECVCQGLRVGSYCDRCYNKQYSSFKFGICQCDAGYNEINGVCVKNSINPNPQNNTCNVATYFDNQQKRCLACSDGCLSCNDCYDCTQCRPDYNFDFVSRLCV